MSFGFRTITDEWRHEDGEVVRELIEVELFDVSPVTFPAYPQTDIAARAFFEARMKSDLQAPPESVPPSAAPSVVPGEPEEVLAIRNKISTMRQKLIEKLF